MNVPLKPTQQLEDRPRSFSLTVAACVFVILLAYLFSCVPGLDGESPKRPASRQIPFQLPISTAEEQGMDADMLAAAYERAATIPSIYSMLVIRHGHLVAEEYFDAQTRTTPMPVASVCKSIPDALVGIALDEGYLTSLDPEWVEDSLEDYSETSWGNYWPYRNIRYGYLWWHAAVDGHVVHFAWGHGGQFVTVVPTLDLVVVTTADNFLGDFSDNSWNTEGAIFRMIAWDVIPAA